MSHEESPTVDAQTMHDMIAADLADIASRTGVDTDRRISIRDGSTVVDGVHKAFDMTSAKSDIEGDWGESIVVRTTSADSDDLGLPKHTGLIESEAELGQRHQDGRVRSSGASVRTPAGTYERAVNAKGVDKTFFHKDGKSVEVTDPTMQMVVPHAAAISIQKTIERVEASKKPARSSHRAMPRGGERPGHWISDAEEAHWDNQRRTSRIKE